MNFRKLAALGLIALALCIPLGLAKAGLHFHGTGGVASAWNGGLVQTSLSASSLGSGEYIPINRMLDSRDWSTVTGNAPVAVNEQNAQGFPSNSANLTAVGGWKTAFLIPASTSRPGNYIVDWTGPGSATINPSATSVVSITGSGCTISAGSVSGANCAATVTWTSSSQQTVGLSITATPSGGLTSLRVYHVNDTAAVAAGQVCKGGSDNKFYQTVGANFGVIRDLNSSNGNFSNVAVWADRTPVGWFSYGANNYFPQSLVTTNSLVNTSGAQYTLAFGGFVLTDKAHVIVNPGAITPPSYTSAQTVSTGNTLQLTSTTGIVTGMVAGDANSGNALWPTVTVLSVAGNIVTFSSSPFIVGKGGVTSGDVIYFSPMLNVNSTGSVPVVLPSGGVYGVAFAPNLIYANWSTLTYDAGLNAWLILNSQTSNQGLTGGMPPEAFTACANEIGAHPWYVFPTYSMDAPTDYVPQLATYAKNNLKPGLIPRFEGPNEDWNYFLGWRTPYSDNKEFPRSGAFQDHDNWYGRAISQAGQTVSSVFGANRALYKVEACMSLAGGIPQAVAVASGSYVSGTGVVTLITSTPITFLGVGQAIVVRGVTGTGSIASVNGVFTTIAGSSGTTIKYTIASGLTLAINSSSGFAEFGLTSQGEKLTSPEYVSNGGSAAYNWVTDICPTAYYESSFAGFSPSEIGWAYWYAHGASSGQQDTLVGNFLAGALTTGFAGNLYWLQNTVWPGFNAYLATFTGIGLTGYEGGYGANAGCGYSYQPGCAAFATSVSVTGVTLGATTTLTVGANAWNYICNTASLCTGGQPTTALSGFAGGCGLNATDPAVLSATSTTVTVNVNSTGFTGCTTGTAAYDGAGGSAGYVATFELAVEQNTNPANLQATELNFLQSFYSAGGRFPAEYLDSDSTPWGKYKPDVYSTNTPVISAGQVFQIAP